MLIRMERPMMGQLHSIYWDLKAGDTVLVDDANGVRYVTAGIATAVAKPSAVRAHWAAVVAEGTTPCRRCSRYIDPGEDWVSRDEDVPGGGHIYQRPEHAACVADAVPA